MSKGEGSRRRGWTTRLSRGWGEAWRGVARCGAVWRGVARQWRGQAGERGGWGGDGRGERGFDQGEASGRRRRIGQAVI